MTFIPLNYKNFVVNKVKNTLNISYQHSDISTHVCNKSLQSKSIINTQNYTNLTKEECGLQENDINLELKKNKINTFYSVISDVNMHAFDYFAEKYSINKSNIFNENIKDFNFKSYSKIDRIEQKFLPNSFELQKKNIVNNSLYNDYKSNYSLDFYKNLKKGFCNYNSINFFSRQYDADVNHANCLIWPNPTSSTGNLYDVYNNSVTLSAYFNLRKNYSNSKQPECILHIPDLFSLYIVKSIGNSTSHRICLVTGKNTKYNISKLNSNIFNSSSRNINTNLNTYVSSDLTVTNNRWYNIALNLNKNEDNSRVIELYIDGNSIDKFSLDFEKENNNNSSSFICIGNKPDYYDEVNDVFKTDYDSIFYQFFGSKLSNDKPVSGPYIKKDISLGRNTSWTDTGQLNIETIISENKAVKFESLKSLKSESFHGEIHDVRIYLQNLDNQKVISNCLKTIETISSETEEFDLCFYVPVFYTPVYCKKQTIVNGNNLTMNTYFSNLYNPYFSNFCGGLEVSAESYLLDFVNLTKPNIVIGGKEYSNIHGDNTNTSVSSLVDSESDVSDIKKGKLFHSIYNKNLNDNSHANFGSNILNNLSYRNLIILPNDNGLTEVRFGVIKEILSDVDYDENSLDADVDYHINTNGLLNKSNYKDDINFNLINDTRNINFDIHISNSSKFSFNFTNDLLYNVSNIIYHDYRIANIANIDTSIQDELFINKLNTVNSILLTTKSNPVTRDYKQNPNNFNISDIDLLHEQSTYDQNISIRYLKLPIPYASVNIDYDCIFSTIFDVSSKLYNNKINKNTFSITDNNLITTNNNVSITLSDDSYGSLYRSDCLTTVAKWNYLGNIFYKEGILSINRPELSYFGVEDFKAEFKADFNMFVHEINIPAESGTLNKSVNKSYNEDLRHDESAFNSESSFVYITDINLHDENLNIIAKAKLARPAPKKNEDNILFKLKMDYWWKNKRLAK